MPLSINVGLSRKASRDYQSTGYSINVTAELDQSLLAKPDELQRQIADLYAQARQALGQQAAPPARPGRDDGQQNAPRDSRRGQQSNGARGNGRAHDGGMTASQRRAILAISERLNIDANQEAIDIVGGALDALTLRQASDLIDHLRTLQPANGNGR